MPAVVVDSSVLITLAAGKQFQLLQTLYGNIFVPPAVWNEVTARPKIFGSFETRDAKEAGWLHVRAPADLSSVKALPFNLQIGEAEALALAVELPGSLVLWTMRRVAEPREL